MLAVKLHPRKRPFLGKGSFLVPIRTWRSGKIQVRNWAGTLGDRARYVTLVEIPDDHPVFIGLDWTVKYGGGSFTELAELDPDVLAKLDLVPPGEKGPMWLQNYLVPEPEPGAPMASHPELILGRRLPARCVKWTKEVRLLYGKRSKPRKTKRQSVGADD